MRKYEIVSDRNYMDSFRVINRKRSRKWLSEETKLLNKYGVSRRYMDLYAM